MRYLCRISFAFFVKEDIFQIKQYGNGRHESVSKAPFT